MPGRREKLQEMFEAIQELLVIIKPQLDKPEIPFSPALTQDLHELASRAELFTQRRTGSSTQFADFLDQEGVSLWNASETIGKSPDEGGFDLVATLKLAAFRLIEAGLETKPGIEGLLRAVQLASEAGVALAELGCEDVALGVLKSAAKFEAMLRNVDDPEGTNQQAIASATIVYFSSRMEVAWKEENYTIIDFLVEEIADNQRLVLLPRARLPLAFKLHRLGNSILRETAAYDGTRAIDWLQKAFSMVDCLEETTTPGVAELKARTSPTFPAHFTHRTGMRNQLSISRTLARAHFLSGSYDRAEVALAELSPSINALNDHESSKYQEIRWLRLAILKRRKAGDSALLDAYKSLIDHMLLSEASITDILQDLQTLGHQHALVAAVNQYLITNVLQCCGAESDYIRQILLALIFCCGEDENHARVMKTLDSAFTLVCEAEFELSSIPTTACLTLIWHYGDRRCHAKEWEEAADWFLASGHQLFRASNPGIGPKCFRKAALCYIEQREYARASTVIRRCPSDAATTQYIIFLTVVHQGLEDDAIKAIQGMLVAQDFDQNLLTVAIQVSRRSDMKGVLFLLLEAVLKTLDLGGEVVVEALTLIREIIGLTLDLLREPKANKIVSIDTLIGHFRAAKVLINDTCPQKTISLIIKDMSWLWRTAYNCAVQCCSEREQHGDYIFELFELARDFLESFCRASPVDMCPESYMCLMNASFSAISGRVFAVRNTIESTGTTDEVLLRAIAAEIRLCKVQIIGVMGKNILGEGDIRRAEGFVHTLRVFEAELLAELKDWGGLSLVIKDVVASGSTATCTYEAVADILWIEEECPINGEMKPYFAPMFRFVSKHVSAINPVDKAILRASLDHGALSVEKFSRWLHAICTILLARNTPADRVKTIGYIRQATGVMNDSEEPYPIDECEWLLNASCKTGAECSKASMFDEAGRWFEVSANICQFVPKGKDYAKKILEARTYSLTRQNNANAVVVKR
ncbi:hypothetical protein BD779DRAFT_1677236 [Infundibulicybe gibba]|nr:hypothetical protein BD779DRAFT_1677236 [Infundibulicybe gibba]